MIKVFFDRDKEQIRIEKDGDPVQIFWAWSKVRNELNGERPDSNNLPDVFHSENQDTGYGLPAMPRPFPSGEWMLTSVEETDEAFTKPVFIRTNATQKLDVWSLIEGPLANGQYSGKRGDQVDDYGYLIHYPNGSNRTQGCIGMQTLSDHLLLVDYLRPFIALAPVPLIVT